MKYKGEVSKPGISVLILSRGHIPAVSQTNHRIGWSDSKSWILKGRWTSSDKYDWTLCGPVQLTEWNE
jgi:hypothetical protein